MPRRGDGVFMTTRESARLVDAQRQCRHGVHATQEIAWLGVAFGMDVAAHSPSLDADEAYESGVLFADSPRALFARSTHVVLSCPLNDGTRDLVGRDLIELMPSEECGRHLVNVARGGVAVEADIAACLSDGSLTSYATDVFAEEP